MARSDGYKNLKPVKKGERRNPNGRPKSTVGELKAVGLNRTEVYNAIGLMLQFSKPELNKISKSESAPVWKVCVARAIMKDIALGYHSTVDSLFDRLFGKAKQTTAFEGSEGAPITGIRITYAKPK